MPRPHRYPKSRPLRAQTAARVTPFSHCVAPDFAKPGKRLGAPFARGMTLCWTDSLFGHGGIVALSVRVAIICAYSSIPMRMRVAGIRLVRESELFQKLVTGGAGVLVHTIFGTIKALAESRPVNCNPVLGSASH